MTDKKLKSVLLKALKPYGTTSIDLTTDSSDDGITLYEIKFDVDDRKLENLPRPKRLIQESLEGAVEEGHFYGLNRADAYPNGFALYRVDLELKK